MSILGPLNTVPTGGVQLLQSTGVNGDLVLGPLPLSQTGVATAVTATGASAGLVSLPTGAAGFFVLYLGATGYKIPFFNG